MAATRATFVVAFQVALAACQDQGRPQAGLEDEIVTRICEARQRCGCPDDLTMCRADLHETVQAAFDEAQAAGLTTDEDCVARMLDPLETYGCRTGHDLGIDERALVWNDQLRCSPFFGDRAEGETCTPLEGSSGSTCARDLRCEDGGCEKFPVWPALGETCDDLLLDCIGDGVCVTDPADGLLRCLPRADAGDACVGLEAVCKPGLRCDADSCVEAPGGGQPCADAMASSNLCAVDAWCDDGTCSPRGTQGDPCSPYSCEHNLYCNTEVGVCLQLAPVVCTYRVP